MIVESYIDRGNSFPVVINKNGKRFFVKLQAGMSGRYGLINEWIGCKVGSQLGITTQIPKWIELTNKLKTEDIYIEVRELINKSLGLNIGFDYWENSIELKESDLIGLDQNKWQNELNQIFLFDLLMLNIDRSPGNLNLMQLDKALVSIDYESCLLVQETLDESELYKNSRILQCFRNNPLYKEQTETEIREFIDLAKKINVQEIVDEIPNILLSTKDAQSFVERIEERKRSDWYLHEILLSLKSISVESPAEQRQRANENQAKFKERFK